MTESDKSLDKKIETLRALLGQDKDSILGLSKPKPSSINSSNKSIDYPVESSIKEESFDSDDFEEIIIQSDSLDTLNESTEMNTEEVYEKIQKLPTATKTFTLRDFLHFKKHSNEQSLVLIKRFLSKHGKPEENSNELQVLTNAISRIISKSKEKAKK